MSDTAESDEYEHLRKDLTVIVVCLPLIYGMMAFWAQCHSWQVVAYGPEKAAKTWGSFEAARAAFHDAYEAALGLGDLYESAAICVFGKLTLEVVDDASKEIEADVTLKDDVVEGYNQKGTMHFEDAVDFDSSSPSGRGLKQGGSEVMSEMHGLRDSRSRLVISGIRYFCICCVLTCIDGMAAPTVYFFMDGKAEHDLLRSDFFNKDIRAFLSDFLYGAGFVTSCIAIENLLVLEINHGEALEKKSYRTFWKFLSAKILVSLVFLQSMIFAFPPFRDYSLVQQNMFKASLLSCECFFIAILHVKSWKTEEEWYQASKRARVMQRAHDREFHMIVEKKEGFHENLLESQRDSGALYD